MREIQQGLFDPIPIYIVQGMTTEELSTGCTCNAVQMEIQMTLYRNGFTVRFLALRVPRVPMLTIFG